jgi:hypothetical protein
MQFLSVVALLNVSVDFGLPVGVQPLPEGEFGGEGGMFVFAKGGEFVGVDGGREEGFFGLLQFLIPEEQIWPGETSLTASILILYLSCFRLALGARMVLLLDLQ